MSESYVKADMKGLEKMIKAFGQKIHVDIGVLEGNKHPEGKETIAFIMSVHEFGTDKAGRGRKTKIPVRSWLKMPLEKKAKEIEKYASKDFEKNLAKGNVDKIMSNIGIASEAQIQEAFESGGFGEWEPNAQSTIDSKGSSQPLIDIGAGRKSISWKVGR